MRNLPTTTGGLIIFGLFLNERSVEECLEKFITLVRSAYTPVISPSSWYRTSQTVNIVPLV